MRPAERQCKAREEKRRRRDTSDHTPTTPTTTTTDVTHHAVVSIKTAYNTATPNRVIASVDRERFPHPQEACSHLQQQLPPSFDFWRFLGQLYCRHVLDVDIFSGRRKVAHDHTWSTLSYPKLLLSLSLSLSLTTAYRVCTDVGECCSVVHPTSPQCNVATVAGVSAE
jgi:hypothetical protein